MEAFLLHYNKKTRYPLLWEKLYDRRPRKRRDEETPTVEDDIEGVDDTEVDQEEDTEEGEE